MGKFIEVVPAYGRDYTSQKAVKDDWNADKDFRVVDFGPDYGKAVNKQDAAGLKVLVRYAKLTRVVQVQ